MYVCRCKITLYNVQFIVQCTLYNELHIASYQNIHYLNIREGVRRKKRNKSGLLPNPHWTNHQQSTFPCQYDEILTRYYKQQTHQLNHQISNLLTFLGGGCVGWPVTLSKHLRVCSSKDRPTVLAHFQLHITNCPAVAHFQSRQALCTPVMGQKSVSRGI